MKKLWDYSPTFCLIMKITCVQFVLAVVFAGLTLARNGMAQELLNRPISVQLDNKDLRTVLNRLEKAANVKFTYVPQLIATGNKVSVRAENDRLEVVLNRLLKPLNITYQVSGNYIVLKKETTSAVFPDDQLIEAPAQRAELTISGVVTDEKGEGLPGVSVLLKGTQRGTATDGKGAFRLAVPDQSAVLVFSFVGYQSQEITVRSQSVLTVRLEADEKSLNEVVVVGYGSVKKRDLTGAVSSISATEVKSQPVSGLNQALQGRAAGVQVTQSSNSPGGGVTIRIRGGNSISANNEPLYVIDGFPVSSSTSFPGGPTNTGTNQNVLATINPNDIESIEILKDASATAIYGSRGANGVVLITTRRGKEGQSNIDFEAYYGVQQIRKMLDLGTAAEHTELKNEQLRNLGFAQRYGYTTQFPKKPEEYGVGTNWQEEIYRPAAVQNYQLSFSGGNDKLRYFVNGNYFGQDGIVINSDFKRYSSRINLDARVSSRLKIGSTITISRAITNAINEVGTNGPVGAALTYSPANPIFDASGNYQLLNVGSGSGFGVFPNPVALAKTSTNTLTSDRVLGNMFGELLLGAGLTARISVGTDILNSRRNTFFSPQTVVANTLNGVGSNGTGNTVNLLNENTLSYTRAFDAIHSIDLLAGLTFQSAKNVGTYQEAQDFPNYALGAQNLGLANNPRPPSGSASRWGLNSYLARANYRFRDKYLLTFTGRVDGSSRFGANHKYGFFPSGAFAWRVSEEPFLKSVRAISDLKFRLSYGITGNDGIGLYNSLSQYGTSRTVFNNTEVLMTQASRIANPDLRWEKTAQFDAGFDVSLLNNRLQLTADYYIKTTTDLLLNVELPATTGFTTVTRNVGSLENRGFELAINTINIDGKVQWTSSGNVSFNRNKVLKLADAEQFFSGATIVKVGESIGSFYTTVFDGIWQTAEEIKQAGLKARTGDLPGAPRFKDVNGDGVFNESTDRTIIGNGLPKFIYGLTNNLSYKGFDLLVFVQGVYGNKLYNATRQTIESTDPTTNQLRTVIEGSWRPDRPSNRIPAMRQWSKGTTSDFIEDGSFLRLKNVSLGYQVPVLPRFIKRARVYVSGQNLLTFTKYVGYDPEVSSDGNSNTLYGFDRFAYPASRTITVGANLTF
ncbi:TonB-dependent receptor [Larkinella knui]|nr:TonB-dependent receptor [Larkinella knui]